MPPALMPTLACMVPTLLTWSHTQDTDSMDTVAASSGVLSDASESESSDDDEDASVKLLDAAALEPAPELLASKGSTRPASCSSRRRLLVRLRRRSCCWRLQASGSCLASAQLQGSMQVLYHKPMLCREAEQVSGIIWDQQGWIEQRCRQPNIHSSADSSTVNK